MTASITTTSHAINMAKTIRRVRRTRGVRVLPPTAAGTSAPEDVPMSPGCGLSLLTPSVCSIEQHRVELSIDVGLRHFKYQPGRALVRTQRRPPARAWARAIVLAAHAPAPGHGGGSDVSLARASSTSKCAYQMFKTDKAANSFIAAAGGRDCQGLTAEPRHRPREWAAFRPCFPVFQPRSRSIVNSLPKCEKKGI